MDIPRFAALLLWCLLWNPAQSEDGSSFHRIMIHEKGTCCMAGTSRNLDRQLVVAPDADLAALKQEYRGRIRFGVDVIETDLPIQVTELLFDQTWIPRSKAQFFQLPSDGE